LAIGTEITPEDAQNLLKAVEGSGRAGDPTAVGKMFDSYLKAKQVFGSAIDSSKIRDYVQNAKGANFGIGEEQFFWQNLVRMTEGNASRLGNETAQTLQTLVGGHATKQTAKWLVDMGLATGFTPQGGGAATINGLSGSGTLQVNQLDWANQFLLPALQKHGVLSEENKKKCEELLRKDNPNIDERALRERAESGLISSAIARAPDAHVNPYPAAVK
jgi:lipase chaperone LimK